jgi:hypothetical protein
MSSMHPRGVAVSPHRRYTPLAARCLRPARPAVSVGADPRTAGTGGIERIDQVVHGIDHTAFTEVTIEGCILRPLPPHQGFREGMPTGQAFGLVNYHLAHLWGRGFGDEAAAGIMLAPAGFNLGRQGSVERIARGLYKLTARLGGEVRVQARGVSYPHNLYGGNVLAEAQYRIHLFLPDETPQAWTVGLSVGPPPSGRPARPEVIGPPL